MNDTDFTTRTAPWGLDPAIKPMPFVAGAQPLVDDLSRLVLDLHAGLTPANPELLGQILRAEREAEAKRPIICACGEPLHWRANPKWPVLGGDWIHTADGELSCAKGWACPVDYLRPRGVYRIHSRNLDVGVWIGRGFIGLRDKLGFVELDEEGPTVQRHGPLLAMVPAEIGMATSWTHCETCGLPACFIGSWRHASSHFGLAGHKVRPRSSGNLPLKDFLLHVMEET